MADLTDLRIVASHFRKNDKIIAGIIEQIDFGEWFTESNREDYFVQLCRTIIYQQLAGRAAETIYNRFAALLGTVIVPDQILGVEAQKLRDAGLSWAKVKYVRDLAEKTISGEIDLTKLDELEDESVITELTRVKGIGRWTAEMFLMFHLRRENIFSYGDLGLKKGFAKLYKTEEPGVDSIEPIIAKWSPYKTYGSIALWHALDNGKGQQEK